YTGAAVTIVEDELIVGDQERVGARAVRGQRAAQADSIGQRQRGEVGNEDTAADDRAVIRFDVQAAAVAVDGQAAGHGGGVTDKEIVDDLGRGVVHEHAAAATGRRGQGTIGHLADGIAVHEVKTLHGGGDAAVDQHPAPLGLAVQDGRIILRGDN